MVAALQTQYQVQLTYRKQVVFRGDSLTAGVGSTLLQSYPYQVLWKRPDWKLFNFGIGGFKLAAMIPEDGTLIDPMFDPAMDENVLCVLAGTNDIGGDGVDGATCFSRLQTWCQGRKAAHPWNIRVLTLPSRRSGWQRVADYNQLIRQGDSNIDRVLDVGLGSTAETALSDPNNLTFFLPDALHLTDLGYGVIADHVSEDLVS